MRSIETLAGLNGSSVIVVDTSVSTADIAAADSHWYGLVVQCRQNRVVPVDIPVDRPISVAAKCYDLAKRSPVAMAALEDYAHAGGSVTPPDHVEAVDHMNSAHPCIRGYCMV